MASVNKVTLIGNLTRDPELKYTPKGTAVCKFGIACNRKWKDDSGQQKEDVTFIDVDAWGRTAEAISQYLKKGRPIYIEGRLKLDQWDDKQTNQKRSKLGVVCESFQFLDSGSGQGSSRPNSAESSGKAPSQSAPDTHPAPEDDDVPF